MAGHTRRVREGDLVTVDYPASTDPKGLPPKVVDTVFFPGPVDNGLVLAVDGDRLLVEDLDRPPRGLSHTRPNQYVHRHYVHRKDT